MKLAWRYRRRAKAYWTIPLLVLALVVFGGWTAARVFVTWIYYKAGNEVLIKPHSCGSITWDDPSSPTQLDLFRTYNLNQSLIAQTRVTQCSGPDADPSSCGIFPNQSISWTGSDADCFLTSSDICISQGSTPYMMESEEIHSSRHLGINAKESDSVSYRRVTTCSPGHGGPFAMIVNANATRLANNYPLDDRMQLYFYGPVNKGFNSFFGETFQYSENTPGFPFAYSLEVYSNEPGYGWTPNITYFDREDATVSIFFLTPNHVGYTGPVHDPWFDASDYTYTIPINPNENKTFWAPSFYVNTLSCIDQHQVCNPMLSGSNRCTGLAASTNILSAVSLSDLQLHDEQVDTVQRLGKVIERSAIGNALFGRGASGLLASRSLSGTIQVPLAETQWRIEMGNLFSLQLANFQQQVIDFAAGPRSALLEDLIVPPISDILQAQCKSQRIKMGNSGFEGQNFNLSALIGVFCGVIVMIALGLSIDSLTFAISKHTGDWRKYQRIAWNLDSLHQIVKQSLQSRGLEWDPPKDDDEEIPFSDKYVRMHNEAQVGDHIEDVEDAAHLDLGGGDVVPLEDREVDANSKLLAVSSTRPRATSSDEGVSSGN